MHHPKKSVCKHYHVAIVLKKIDMPSLLSNHILCLQNQSAVGREAACTGRGNVSSEYNMSGLIKQRGEQGVQGGNGGILK